jgi:hypothetical protein
MPTERKPNTPRLEKECQKEGFERCWGTGPEVMKGVAKYRRVLVSKGPHKGEYSTKSRQTKDMLTYNKDGKVVLKSRSRTGKKNYKVLTSNGYTVQKGVFGTFHEGVNITKKKAGSTRRRKTSSRKN